ncbi:hypothetical protein pzkkv8_94 [Klebsiella phage pzk-kv8]|nr:hypothetical protein pzkkv8_94 [Klebsiella phage pzk-kv8]
MSKFEIVSEIITMASLLIKFQREDILENREGFIAFLNECGIRNEFGRELNSANFRKMVTELSDDEKKQLIQEFNVGHESVYRHMEMYANN